MTVKGIDEPQRMRAGTHDRTIDLRSDTVTNPTPEMRDSMAAAEVGDDVYGEDRTVNRLEALAAKMLGTEAALFTPSGTQCNLLALLCHCERGDEYVVGQDAHTYRYEGGGAAVLGSIQPQPLDFEPDGTLDLSRVAAVIKPDDFHFARTRLLCLENTQGGKVLPLEYLEAAADFARANGLALHLDGARLFNAAVRLQLPASRIARHFDTVSVCLSKGLGAPVGSVLCGSTAVIANARRWRKMLGGGMRQAGIVAAGGIHALTFHVERLATDHDNARRLAEGLASIDGLQIDPAAVQTNMVFVDVGADGPALQQFLGERGIIVTGKRSLRLVTHLDISADDISNVVDAFRGYYLVRRAAAHAPGKH